MKQAKRLVHHVQLMIKNGLHGRARGVSRRRDWRTMRSDRRGGVGEVEKKFPSPSVQTILTYNEKYYKTEGAVEYALYIILRFLPLLYY